MENSESTYRRLVVENEQRYQELKNLEQLEDKIKKEVVNLTEKIHRMENDINTKYNKVEEVKAKEEKRKDNLLHSKEDLTKNIRSVKEEVIFVTTTV